MVIDMVLESENLDFEFELFLFSQAWHPRGSELGCPRWKGGGGGW